MIYYTFDDNFKGYKNVVTDYVCRTKATLQQVHPSLS